MKPGSWVRREEGITLGCLSASQLCLSSLTSLSPVLVLDHRPVTFLGVKTSPFHDHLELSQHSENPHGSHSILWLVFLCPCLVQPLRRPFFTVCPWFRWKMWKVYTQGFLFAGMILLPAPQLVYCASPTWMLSLGYSDLSQTQPTLLFSIQRTHGSSESGLLMLKNELCGRGTALNFYSVFKMRVGGDSQHSLLPTPQSPPKLQLLCFSNFNFSNGK